MEKDQVNIKIGFSKNSGLTLFPAEHEIMSQMQASFEKVARLESDVMSECKIKKEECYDHFIQICIL